jgi:serine/threonine-protein kinase PknK
MVARTLDFQGKARMALVHPGLADVVGKWRLCDRLGEGATAVVWRAEHVATGVAAALKLASGGTLLREAEIVGRLGRRWGPTLLDRGVAPDGRTYLVSAWTDGAPVSPTAIPEADRERVAAMVAHGVGRGLAELHEASIRHGDVKPANVLLRAGVPLRDAADDRRATLIDLGFATDSATADLHGLTIRYAPPETSAHVDSGPAGDRWSLGILLGEILDPSVAASDDPRAGIASWSQRGEVARWVEALVALSPGARPSASWLATRAARWLSLARDEGEEASAREAQVRRAYLGVRRRDVQAAGELSAAITGPTRQWLEDAIVCTGKLERRSGAEPIEPLGAIDKSRWLTALVGTSAAGWTLDHLDESTLAARLVALARDAAPEAWTRRDVLEGGAPSAWEAGEGDERVARLVAELSRAVPNLAAVATAEDDVAAGRAPRALTIALVEALVRIGDVGRAWASVVTLDDVDALPLRAEVARRRGDRDGAKAAATRAKEEAREPGRSRARATLARLAWDAGELEAAERELTGALGAAAAEGRALVSYARGTYDVGLRALDGADTSDGEGRIEAARGMLEHARGDSVASARAFARAVAAAARSGAVVDEATYLTSEAAASVDSGDVSRAIAAASRAALLWERLGQQANAARAWLARAAALAAVGAQHDADEAATEARERALGAGDRRAAAFARWALVETRAPGDPVAVSEVLGADEELRPLASDEDAVRASARVLVWAANEIDDVRIIEIDRIVDRVSATARWEWWGARARAASAGRGADDGARVLGAVAALVDVPAPIGSRGPALAAAGRLAADRGDGDAARRFEVARRAAANALRDATAPAYRATLATVSWARDEAGDADDSALAPGQIAQLESITRALGSRDRLRPLLDQVLDTMVLWTGVERGMLLLRAPDGRLVPRAARNLARHDLVGEQLALSQGIARRAVETGEPVVAIDALATHGALHASVHALKLRSVLAVPLVARGETLGVVYLDDRMRSGAFGARELAWVRLVASQAAMAIADARDKVLLKRAARRAERARRDLEAALGAREVELGVVRGELGAALGERGTRHKYDAIIGESPGVRTLLRLIDRVAATEILCLISGESGTGKELVARAIHENGPRAQRPFVGENCASVPETLLESTLFGHVRGAFTGASSTRAGLFDVADGGTLFLDEIGEMSLGMQSKLLRVLQDGEVRAVGGERTRRVDVRVLGATHRDLSAMVAAGTFREDLYYRLNVLTIPVPALRERADDIPELVAHFLDKHAPGRAPKVTRAAMERLAAYPWPGNIRQLENEMRRAIVLADGRIDVPELSADVARGGPSAARGAGLDLRARVDALEVELVTEALEKTRGNQTRAAELLGMSRFGLQKMMKRLGVRSPD